MSGTALVTNLLESRSSGAQPAEWRNITAAAECSAAKGAVIAFECLYAQEFDQYARYAQRMMNSCA